jgi:hypothetical protein
MKLNKFVLSAAVLSGLALGGLQATTTHAITTEQAESNLTTGIYNKMAEDTYTLEGGGTVSGKELFNKKSNGSSGTSYDVNEDQFKDLTKKEQQRFTTKLVEEANAQVGNNGVTSSTVTGLLQRLQTKPGMGSKLLTEILKNTKPDYVKANNIYQPFSGIIGTILGLGAILILAFIGIVIVSDIAFITLPPYRALLGGVDGGDSERGKTAKFLVSHEAVSSVRESENSDGGQGGYKYAIGIYLKRRIIALIILGIALLYLVQGQIYVFVGFIMDLVQGFLGA